MYRLGHFGMALLVYAPVAFGLALLGVPGLALVGAVISIVFARLPDLDQRLPITHRGPTHTVWFALAVGLGVGGGWSAIITWFRVDPGLQTGPVAPPPLPGVISGLFLGGLASLSVCSHLLADVITPAGLRPFTPISDTWYSVEVTTAKNRLANGALLLLGTGAVGSAIYGGTVLAARLGIG